jgi:endonuclease/exonuclease/phosphatase (EEP) superfamily protein YafD
MLPNGDQHMRRTCAGLAIAALVAAGLATAVGFLAPWWPVADMPNHFTPFVLAAALSGLGLLLPAAPALAALGRARIAIGVGLAGLAAVNAAPLLASLATVPVAARGATDTLTVVSFNIFTRNRQLDEAARWLAAQDADVIVLQEMTRTTREPIKRALAARYPYIQRDAVVMADAAARRRHRAAPARDVRAELALAPARAADRQSADDAGHRGRVVPNGPSLGSDHLPGLATVALR